MLVRPSHIGLLLVVVIAVSLLLIPGRQEGEKGEENNFEFPPALYPAFPEQETATIQEPLIRIQKAPVLREVPQGSTFHFSVSVENISDRLLKDLSIEERFDGAVLDVTNAEDGEISENLVAWNVPELEPEGVWLATYDVTVKEEAREEVTETTFHVRGEGLENTTSASRMKTSLLKIIQMPETGVVVLQSRLRPLLSRP